MLLCNILYYTILYYNDPIMICRTESGLRRRRATRGEACGQRLPQTINHTTVYVYLYIYI